MNTILKTQISAYTEKYQSLGTTAVTKPKQTLTISDTKQKVLKQAQQCWENYSTSTHGAAQLKAVTTTDLPTTQAMVANLINSPEFADLKATLDTLNIPASSFSIGLNIEVEFIIGFAATIGVAIGIGDSKGVATSEFLSVGITEGIDEGGLVGVQFGIWDNAPSDLGGYAWSTEVDLGFGAEISTAVSYSVSGGILGATLTIGGGEEDGIMEEESYTFIIGSQEGNSDGYLRPAYQPQKNNLLIVTSLKCKHPSNDGAGNENEVYFTFQADSETMYYYPTYDYYSMKEGDTWSCGRSIWFNESINIKIYDDDGLHSDNDLMGNYVINLSNLVLGETKTFNSTKDYSHGLDNIEYTINVKLVAQNAQN
ncbi:hypothetical protein [uncultured Dokdonia sp.]|uniref:hypothetical protein n=1 Tax=uncultured Dokdonia sp. TaxID=575653 RepID=UPI00262C13A6|nr:hypothetical protein [uncultured Dokdonia sp.]